MWGAARRLPPPRNRRPGKVHMARSQISLSALLVAAAWWPGIARLPAAGVDFGRDIRPILADNCFACHGPDAANRKADLRLDVRDEAVAAGAIVPGKPEESGVVERIRSSDPDTLMPPPDSHKPLDDRQKDLLGRWIAAGAEYTRHWAYEPPRKSEVPAGANAIDHLVRRRLAQIGLESSPEADRRTLIRRLSFDLLGLPPTPEEVEAFERDTSSDAYGKLVERLLASPHYGERMAIAWLDVVRFADTIGYHSDNPRNIWPYRDWVIAAFNDNKPFDRFTIEQVAGDLLPDADDSTRTGSAFNRLLLTTEEGGAQPKDYESRMLTDRVRAIGSAWLGQTTGCAQCHDHKFDPITMRDFYSLGAFFADIQEPILGKREDGMAVPSADQRKRLVELDAAVTAAKQRLEAATAEIDTAQTQWEADVAAGRVELAEIASGSNAPEPARKAASQVAAILAKEAAARSDQERGVVRDYFRTKVSPQGVADREALAKAEQEAKRLRESFPKCLVTTSGNPRTVRILPRGNWMDESGEAVKPALPAYLAGPRAEGRDLNRLDLAKWLVSRDNPLTARVAMNRLWKQFFGTGLSKLLDDLGSQGEQPANQELLDWLACEFVDSGWNVKHMVRTVVTSATYRQASHAAPGALAADPDNREVARQSAFRVDAELVRDAALATSGLLVRTIGGPSVKPYQPDGYWENLNFPQRSYPVDNGASQHRRGLYTWWQRTFLHPSMLAFDAPSREECCAERTRSNIPQQALVLLNDPSYVEASRTLAARILTECGGTAEERVAWAWRTVLQRLPRVEEMETVLPLLRRHLEEYKANPAAAEQLLRTGQAAVPSGVDKAELAAWTHLARVLLNLHETITRS